MGLLDWILGRKDDSVIDSTITGAATGAVIGDKLDERAHREEVTNLLRAFILQHEHHEKQKDLQQTFGLLLDDVRKTKQILADWPWMWEHHELWHDQRFALAMVDDQPKLRSRWIEVRDRALELGYAPWLDMPRAIWGDVVGTRRQLMRTMDLLEVKLDVYQRTREIEARFGW